MNPTNVTQDRDYYAIPSRFWLTGPCCDVIDVQVLFSACRSACAAAGIDKRETVQALLQPLLCRRLLPS
ncbi:hypothetical protein FFR93_39830 [Rhizobium sp. MHM7A]|nr:hypothetical protein FFR93_39830 [Rhizobium sp. MHM7A]